MYLSIYCILSTVSSVLTLHSAISSFDNKRDNTRCKAKYLARSNNGWRCEDLGQYRMAKMATKQPCIPKVLPYNSPRRPLFRPYDYRYLQRLDYKIITILGISPPYLTLLLDFISTSIKGREEISPAQCLIRKRHPLSGSYIG